MNNSTLLLRESQNIIAALAQLYAKNVLAVLDAAGRRKIANQFFIEQSGKSETVEEMQNFSISSSKNDFQIPVRLYHVNDTSAVLLFVHGGGWVQGNLDTHDYLCRKIATTVNVNVIAVDYRLAPENPFPTPLEDVFDVYDWCCKRYDKVYVAGDSAGGNLCAALCIKGADEQLPKPHSMVLFYPVLSDNFFTESYITYAYMLPLSQASMMYFFAKYRGDFGILPDKLLTPHLETDMSVFPRTFIVSAECDVLLTEQCDFVRKMHNAKKECRHMVVDGAIHGFMTYGREFDNYNTDILKQIAMWL